MSEEEGEGGGVNRIDVRLGSLSVEVQGEDPEWVSDTYDEKLENLLKESEEMSKALRDGTRGCD